jgi:hypothetical protein
MTGALSAAGRAASHVGRYQVRIDCSEPSPAGSQDTGERFRVSRDAPEADAARLEAMFDTPTLNSAAYGAFRDSQENSNAS